MSLATPICCPKNKGWGWPKLAVGVLFAFSFGASPLISAPSASELEFANYTHSLYVTTGKEHAAHPTNSELAWKFARACFDTAEFATNSAQRAELAQQGITAAREVLARDPKSAPAHYYLAMNLGQLARTRGLSALRLVKEMEKEFGLARTLDEHVDFAGPDRNLGLLYRDAPSIGSIGSRTKARKHLTRATDIAPDFPENRLQLLESYLKWDDPDSARRELKALEELWPKARTNFVGEKWDSNWADWTPRFQDAKRRLQQPRK